MHYAGNTGGSFGGSAAHGFSHQNSAMGFQPLAPSRYSSAMGIGPQDHLYLGPHQDANMNPAPGNSPIMAPTRAKTPDQYAFLNAKKKMPIVKNVCKFFKKC